MVKNHRSAAVVSVGVLTALLGVSACGSSSSPASSPTGSTDNGPVVWWYPGPDTVEGTSNAIAAEFTKETGIKVDAQMSPWDGYTTKVTTAITSGQVPDLVEIGNTDAPTLGASGSFMPWDAAAFDKVGGRTQFVQAAIDAYTPAGKDPNSLPLGAGVWCMVYNKAMFQTAGIQPPTTWDDFTTAAKKLTNASKGVYGVAMAAGTPGAMNTWAWIIGQQNGVPYYTPDGKPQVNTPAMVSAMADLLKWVYPDQIMSTAVVADNFNGDNALLTSGKAAMDFTQNPQAAIDHPDQYGVAYIPLPATPPAGGKKVMSHVAGVNVAVFKNAAHKEAAIKFAKFLMGDKAQVMEAKGEVGLPVTLSALNDPYFQTPSMKALGDILAKYAAATPLAPTSGQLLNGVGDALVKLYQSTASSKSIDNGAIEAALANVEQTVAASG